MTEPISETRNHNREESVRSAMEDIALIRRMIDHTEINMHRLGWLFLVYGLVFLAYSLFSNFSGILIARTASLKTVGDFSIIMTVLTYVVTAVLFVLFLRKRAAIVKSENEHTMKLFDLWGVIMFVPAALELVISLTVIIATDNLPVISIAMMRIVFSVIKSTALIMCIFFTGHYTGSRFLKIISGVLVLLVIVLYTCGISLEGIQATESDYFMQLTGIINMRSSIASLVLFLVYIGMGIYCIVKQRGSAHGDE